MPFRILIALLLTFTALPGTAAGEREDAVDAQVIYVTMGVLDVDAINSASQSFTLNLYVQFRWRDPRLAHEGPGSIRRELKDIHAPRFLLLNRQRTWTSLLNVVDITPDGEARFRMRLWGDFSQIMHLQSFPFDTHRFEVPAIAIPHTDDDIVLLPDPETDSFMAEELSVADWRVIDWRVQAQDMEITNGYAAQAVVFAFKASRQSGYYLIKYIIPLILIVAMSWVVFWIDPSEAGSQLSVAVTAVLTLIAYHIALTGKLPDISYLTRMDLFLFGSTLLVFASLIEVVMTSRLARMDRLILARRMDLVCRALFPLVYLVITYLSLVSGVGASF
jgi:hypothetical protein